MIIIQIYVRYNQLLGIIPCDPGVLQKVGEMYDATGDKQQAYQFYSDVNFYLVHLSHFILSRNNIKICIYIVL